MSALKVDDAEHFVTISFWRTDDCSGELVASNSFPVDYGSERCYSFTYTQWITMTFSGGRNPPGMVKTNYSDQCREDVPLALYAKVTDFSGCENSQ
jgi:hypothetical protein